jgi:hypothetical protein
MISDQFFVYSLLYSSTTGHSNAHTHFCSTELHCTELTTEKLGNALTNSFTDWLAHSLTDWLTNGTELNTENSVFCSSAPPNCAALGTRTDILTYALYVDTSLVAKADDLGLHCLLCGFLNIPEGGGGLDGSIEHDSHAGQAVQSHRTPSLQQC